MFKDLHTHSASKHNTVAKKKKNSKEPFCFIKKAYLGSRIHAKYCII